MASLLSVIRNHALCCFFAHHFPGRVVHHFQVHKQLLYSEQTDSVEHVVHREHKYPCLNDENDHTYAKCARTVGKSSELLQISS